MRLLPLGTHEYKQFINAEDIENILSEVNVRRLAQAGVMVKNPITMEMTETPNYVRANYMMMFKKIV